jgi:hypothetical protein
MDTDQPNEYAYEDIILNAHNNKYIIRTRDNNGDQYWYYKAFQPVKKIAERNNHQLLLCTFTDSLAILTFQRKDSVLIINKFDYNENLYTSIEINDFKCIIPRSVEGILLNNNQYLLSTNCTQGDEPYILDIHNGTLEILADIIPGTSSSSPRDFIKFKDWVYFTATIEDKSRQWFRLATGETSHTIEIVTETILPLNVYPSPANDLIRIDQYLDELIILDINGQIIFKIAEYQPHQSIDITHLPTGNYVIYGKSTTNQFQKGQFVKVK